MKCNSISDKGTVNCWKAFRCPSCTRQSYFVRQYTTSCRRYARSVPYRQPASGISSGQRTRSSLARRSASVASGIRMVKGVSSKTISCAQRCLAYFVYGLSYVEAKPKADDEDHLIRHG